MKKALILGSAFVLGMSLFSEVFAATNKNYKSLKGKQSSFTNNFASGTFVSGSTLGRTGSNAARRWYIFNEGSVGGSYTMLGNANYWALDLGYRVYMRTIETFGLINFIGGLEIDVPLYLSANGKSNVIYNSSTDKTMKPFETSETSGLRGWGIEPNLMLGFEIKGFYLTGLFGYSFLSMSDIYTTSSRGAHPIVTTNYDGITYGVGVGYKFSNVVNVGFRYVTSSMMTLRKDTMKFDAQGTADGLDQNNLAVERGRNIYNVQYDKFNFFISVIF